MHRGEISGGRWSHRKPRDYVGVFARVAHNPADRVRLLETHSWRFFLAVPLGLVIGLSIKVAVLLYAFGCLFLPGFFARNVARGMFSMFLIAPVVAFVLSVLAFVLAHHYDLPPSQMTVALLSFTVGVSRLVRRQSRFLKRSA